MGVKSGPRIVTNGLIFDIDAAVPRSYSGSGTSWLDISQSGFNLVTRNSPTFVSANASSYFTLNGTNQDFYLASFGPTLTSATFNLWVWRNGTQSGYDALVSNISRSGFIYDFNGTSFSYIWNNDVNTYSYSSGVNSANQTWAMATLTISPTEAKWYLNGILQHTNVYVHSSTSISNLNIGSDLADLGANRFYNGRIAQVQIYNRALTAQEILQNYNATKGRYI
jgi:hypothetical protein